MFTDDSGGESKGQEPCDLSECPELEDPVDGPGLSAVTDSSDLNLVMGTKILQGKTDSQRETAQTLRRLM